MFHLGRSPVHARARAGPVNNMLKQKRRNMQIDMEVILAIATLIGGIAAVHFYWDKIPERWLSKFLRKRVPRIYPSAKCCYEGVSDKNLALMENIKYGLSEIENLEFQTSLSGFRNGSFNLDFVVDLPGSKVFAIIAAYDESEYLSKNTIDKIFSNISNAKYCDDFFSFLVVTNSQVREDDKEALNRVGVKIDFNEDECTPGALYTSLSSYYRRCISSVP
jgi:hypothetical protein